ncbi:MAG: two-component system response regulator [Herbinix sp.]|jgi:DNA-binding NarL/FixJ family response regulator|nr:two-component system response regulator [Herbinix sp.]
MKEQIKILIADDFRLLIEDMSETINSHPDMKVVGTACSGTEIVKLANALEYDIILMDIEMENIVAGIMATETIRDMNSEAKIIFLTAHETNNIILSAMGAGAIDYIVKGSPDEEIIEHIRCAYKGNPILNVKIHEIIIQEYKRLQKSEQSLIFFINNIATLTNTERILIRMLLDNKKVAEIAKERSVEIVTIKTQINGLLKKFGCSRTKDIVKLIRNLNLSHLF